MMWEQDQGWPAGFHSRFDSGPAKRLDVTGQLRPRDAATSFALHEVTKRPVGMLRDVAPDPLKDRAGHD